jgi:hypothetical protein
MIPREAAPALIKAAKGSQRQLIEVAGNLVTGGHFDEIGLSLGAARHGEGTAGVEVAA